MKILIVEDNKLFSKSLSLVLSSYYSLDLALSGEEAILKIHENNYDLILLDIQLGEGINGFDVLKNIREMKSSQNIPVIGMSAIADFIEDVELSKYNFDKFLEKPFSISLLLENIKELLN